MDLAQDSDELSQKNEALIHKTIKKVTADIDDLKMNTAIAALMAMVNEFYTNGLTRGDLEQLMLLLSPFAPHGRGDVGAYRLCRQDRQNGHADALAHLR